MRGVLSRLYRDLDRQPEDGLCQAMLVWENSMTGLSVHGGELRVKVDRLLDRLVAKLVTQMQNQYLGLSLPPIVHIYGEITLEVVVLA